MISIPKTRLPEDWRESLALWVKRESADRVWLAPDNPYCGKAELPPAPPMPEHGAGTLAMKQIDLRTHGMGKIAATAIAKFFGRKNCGCEARARCMNQAVPDVRALSPFGWVLATPGLLMCIGAKDDTIETEESL